MGSLILCHRKRAKQPYEISRVHIRIYTIEELCYYICNNLYLLDYTIINRQLCNWIAQELELKELADCLREELQQNCGVEQFVLTILRESTIYGTADINKIQNVLERLQNQKEVERMKYKADSLLESGEYETAILVYQAILNQEWDDSMKKEFYGKIYACLGASYGHLFLYEEASRMYLEAYRICSEEEMLKAYLYCCRRYLPGEKYLKMLSGNPVYLGMESALKEEIRETQFEVDVDIQEERLEQWRKEYRRIKKKTGTY